ncbi:IclR family transcriptional regulator [Pollutimonas harenae]|nr:IclR family transcriptional regulator [Pollutimonas harenae]
MGARRLDYDRNNTKMTINTQSEKLVGALSSGLAILRYLVSSPEPVGVTRIAKDLSFNSSTCFNLLKTLVHERIVRFDETTKTYSIGLGVVQLAKGTLDAASYVRLLRPHLQEIAVRHRVTSTLWHRIADERVVLVDLADSESTIRIHMSIGQRLPMYIAALGRCMAAFSSLDSRELRSRISKLRWDDGPSFETYLKEVQFARTHGYAVDHSHYVKGITTVSSPILDETGVPIMAISAVGISAQFSDTSIQALGEDLRHRCEETTQALSGGKASLLNVIKE